LRAAVVCEPESLLAKSRFAERVFPISLAYTRFGWVEPIIQAIESYAPDIVLPCDDGAACLLTAIARKRTDASKEVVALLNASLGDVSTTQIRFSRQLLHDVARTCGISTPPGKSVTSAAEVEEFADELGWPVVLKSDASAGGAGVRVCQGTADIAVAFKDISVPLYQPDSAKRIAQFIGAAIKSHFRLAGDLARPAIDGSPYSVEAHVAGKPAYSTVLAKNGEVLAILSLLPRRTHPGPRGPSSIVTAIDSPAMEDAARRLVARLGFTGYCGLDFMIEDGTNHVYFIELNPRATQVVHLGATFGVDLCQGLAAVLRGSPVPKSTNLSSVAVALFPQDFCRDPSGADRPADIVDLPTDDPALLAALSAYVPAGAVIPVPTVQNPEQQPMMAVRSRGH
jgi:hypothetical protein